VGEEGQNSAKEHPIFRSVCGFCKLLGGQESLVPVSSGIPTGLRGNSVLVLESENLSHIRRIRYS
jgi:hypothetical protein